MLVQVVVQQAADHVVHVVADGLPARFHVLGAQLGFGLGVENGVFDLDGHVGDDGIADIRGLEVLLEEVAESLDDGLAHGLLVGAAVLRVLAVDERVVLLAVFPVGVDHGEFEVVVFQVDRLIQGVVAHFFVEQIQEAVFGVEAFAVEVDGQAAVQIDVVPEQILDVFGVPFVVLEDGVVGEEGGHRAVLLVGRLDGILLGQQAGGEFGSFHLAIAHALHEQVRGERVHRLHAHAVHADGCEIALEVAARVHLGVAIDHLVQGDAAAVVAHGHAVFLDGDVDDFAVAVHELVDGVVHHLLQEHVDAVVVRRAVALLADVHAGSRPDVLVPIQGYNVIILIICHITVLQIVIPNIAGSRDVVRNVST